MNTTNERAIPIWFWIVAVISLLWNIMGLFAFYSDMTITQDALSALTPEHQELYKTQPLWAKIVFGGAVIFGVIGSVGLLMRKRWARPILVISLFCVLLQTAHGFMSNTYDVVGSSAMVMASIILFFAAFIVWFARISTFRGYLR